jgi:hypothetical protein
MPFSMNGVGTSVSGSRGDIGWGSHDAMECFVIFFMPIFPYKAMHTFDWNGDQYRAIPIRWSWDLVLRTYVKPWSWGMIAISAVLFFIAFLEASKGKGNLLVLAAVGAVLLGFGVLGLVLLHYTDQRNKAIRRVIGGITIGTCDPANLKGDLLKQMTGDTKILYGTDTFAAAVEPQLAKGALAQAMWAARMAVAVEDRREGERLTDLVLRDPAVVAAVEEVRRKPDNWVKVMLTPEQAREIEEAQRLDVRAPRAAAIPAPPITDARTYDDEDDRPRKPRAKGEGVQRRRDDEDY